MNCRNQEYTGIHHYAEVMIAEVHPLLPISRDKGWIAVDPLRLLVPYARLRTCRGGLIYSILRERRQKCERRQLLGQPPFSFS